MTLVGFEVINLRRGDIKTYCHDGRCIVTAATSKRGHKLQCTTCRAGNGRVFLLPRRASKAVQSQSQQASGTIKDHR